MNNITVPTPLYKVDGPPNRGLWYNSDGKYVGEIHQGLAYLQASAFEMPFDLSLVGWRSATLTPQELLQWITLAELKILESEGFFASVYEAEEIREYIHTDPATGKQIPHLIFRDETAKLIEHLSVSQFSALLAVPV